MGLKDRFENPDTTTIHNGNLGVVGKPKAALKDPAISGINNTFKAGEYDVSLPDEIRKQAQDLTD
tara:strand:- start:174 stop:368 length:195 start_codon:yes stop_codon:yes gene_type:complete